MLALNQAHVPAVGALHLPRLTRLVERAETAVPAEVDGDLAAFVVVLRPGVGYGRPNDRWFSQRYDDFAYVDRVVVDATYQRGGLGHALYDCVEASTDAAVVCCEVNLHPRNEPSLRFHERRGFQPVGDQDTDGASKRVALLAKSLG